MKNAKTATSADTDAARQNLSATRKDDAKTTQKNTVNAAPGNTDAFALLKADHRKVEQLFEDYKKADAARKADLAKQICSELIIHTTLEEELFYPACREKGVESDDLDEAQVEHDGAKVLIADVLHGHPGDSFYDAKVNVLAEYIKHHVGEEEMPRTGIFAQAKKAGIDAAKLGGLLQARKTELAGQKQTLEARPLKTRALHLHDIQPTEEDTKMSRYSSTGNRDQGRYGHDEDFGGSRGMSQNRNQSGRTQNYGQSSGQNYGRDQDHRMQGSQNYGLHPDEQHYDDNQRRYGAQSSRGRSETGYGNDHDDDHFAQDRSSGRDYNMASGNRSQGRTSFDDDHRTYNQNYGQHSYGNQNTGNRGYGQHASNFRDEDIYNQSTRGRSNESEHRYGQQDDFGTQRGSRGQYGMSNQSGQYSQSQHDQPGRTSSQYGQDDTYRQGRYQNQSSQTGGYQGRNQQTSQGRYTEHEDQDHSYGGQGSGAQGYGGSSNLNQSNRSQSSRHDQNRDRGGRHWSDDE